MLQNITVNYFDIGIIVFMIVFAVSGYVRGLIISVVNFIRFSLGAFLCFYLSTNASKPIYDSLVKEKALESINKYITNSNNIDTVLGNLNDAVDNLPGFIAKGIDLKTVDITSADLAKTILDNVFEPVLTGIIKVAVFVFTLIVFFGATGVIIHILKKRSKKKEEERGKKSVAKKTDKILGFAVGAMKGAVIVFALCSVLMFAMPSISNITGSKTVIQQMENSVCLEYINEINPFNAITEEII